MCGWVYAVQMLIPDYVQPIKFGFSSNPEIRLKSYNSEPFPVEWLGSWLIDDRSIENSIHRRFANYRMRGEWFFPASVLLSFIKAELTKPGALLGNGEIKAIKRAEELRNAQRWNLARLAADGSRLPWFDHEENAEYLSSVFDRSVVSHEALKSAWRR